VRNSGYNVSTLLGYNEFLTIVEGCVTHAAWSSARNHEGWLAPRPGRHSGGAGWLVLRARRGSVGLLSNRLQSGMWGYLWRFKFKSWVQWATSISDKRHHFSVSFDGLIAQLPICCTMVTWHINVFQCGSPHNIWITNWLFLNCP
jgi:hypothetical protein